MVRGLRGRPKRRNAMPDPLRLLVRWSGIRESERWEDGGRVRLRPIGERGRSKRNGVVVRSGADGG